MQYIHLSPVGGTGGPETTGTYPNFYSDVHSMYDKDSVLVLHFDKWIADDAPYCSRVYVKPSLLDPQLLRNGAIEEWLHNPCGPALEHETGEVSLYFNGVQYKTFNDYCKAARIDEKKKAILKLKYNMNRVFYIS